MLLSTEINMPHHDGGDTFCWSYNQVTKWPMIMKQYLRNKTLFEQLKTQDKNIASMNINCYIHY